MFMFDFVSSGFLLQLRNYEIGINDLIIAESRNYRCNNEMVK